MKILSVNSGLPRTVEWHGREVLTGIFKSPVAGPVPLRRLNLDGDAQADLANHGGIAKAVYAYPSEHYSFWQTRLPALAGLPAAELPPGAFGENLTTEGLLETHACIGDHFRAGTAVLMVTQPRIPCYKLGIRLGRDEIVQEFLRSNRSGIYFAVIEEGVVRAGDAIERVHPDPRAIPVAGINRLYWNFRGDGDKSLLRRALEIQALGPGIRKHFQELTTRRGSSS
ncbi:MAG TPA: MOSC domain-containing protein [Candidatus Acidoferrales bacterium]|nr:MOSC domain-containing protein [Candidatus Acidoferrales bacterium]